MGNIKTYEGFLNFLKKSEEDKTFSHISDHDSKEIMIDKNPHDVQFGQEKYCVYIWDTFEDKTYHIGDIRKFNKSSKYLSYLEIDKVSEMEPKDEIVYPDDEQMEVIQKELDRHHLSGDIIYDHERKLLQNK